MLDKPDDGKNGQARSDRVGAGVSFLTRMRDRFCCARSYALCMRNPGPLAASVTGTPRLLRQPGMAKMTAIAGAVAIESRVIPPQ